MTRRVFIKKLQKYLTNIPSKEREDIEKFYNEMFEEEGIGFDDEVPESFGDPKHIAYDIISNESEFEEEKGKDKANTKKYKGLKTLKILKGLPVFIPIVAVLAIIFSIFIVTLIFYIFSMPFIFLATGTVNFTLFLYIFSGMVVFGTILWIIKYVFKKSRRKIFKHKNKWNFDDVTVEFNVKDDNKDFKNFKKGMKNMKYNFENVKDTINVNINFETEDDYDDYCMDNMKNYQSQDVGRIILDLNGSNLEIVESDEDEIKIDATKCKRTKIETKVENGCLYIDTAFCENNKNELLVLEIPNGLEFKGEINGGNVEIEDVDFSDIFLEVDSGNLEINEVNAKMMNIEVREGNVELEDIDVKNIRLEVESGNIEVDKLETEDFNIEVNAGNTELNDVNSVNCKFEINAGNIEVDNLNAEIFDVDSNAGNVELTKVTTKECRLEVNAGNIEIDEFIAEKLEIESNTGNVEGNIISVDKMTAEASMGNIELEINKKNMTYNYDSSMGIVNVNSKKYTRDKNNPDIYLEVAMGNIELR